MLTFLESELVTLRWGIGQKHTRPAFDVAAKWPALALYDKQNAVGVEIAVDVVDVGDHGPTAPWFRLCCLWTRKGSGRGAFKILDVAMMQSQG